MYDQKCFFDIIIPCRNANTGQVHMQTFRNIRINILLQTNIENIKQKNVLGVENKILSAEKTQTIQLISTYYEMWEI